MIFHRLEHICYTIEHGEWPFARRPPASFFPPGTPTHATDSRSETPVSSALKSDSATGADSDQSEGLPTSELTNQVNLGTGSEVTPDSEFLVNLTPEVRQTWHSSPTLHLNGLDSSLLPTNIFFKHGLISCFVYALKYPLLLRLHFVFPWLFVSFY